MKLHVAGCVRNCESVPRRKNRIDEGLEPDREHLRWQVVRFGFWHRNYGEELVRVRREGRFEPNPEGITAVGYGPKIAVANRLEIRVPRDVGLWCRTS